MAQEISNEEGTNAGGHERIERTAAKVKDSTHSAVSSAKEKLGKAADSVESGVGRATDASVRGAERMTDKASEWRDRGNDALDNVRDFVRERPVQSVAIALAAGWLVGKLLHRRG